MGRALYMGGQGAAPAMAPGAFALAPAQQSSYGQPPPPPYGASSYGQSSYGQPPPPLYGQSSYGQQPPSPYGAGGPNRGSPEAELARIRSDFPATAPQEPAFARDRWT